MAAIGEVPDRVSAGQAEAEPGEPGEHSRGPDHGRVPAGDPGDKAPGASSPPAPRISGLPSWFTSVTADQAGGRSSCLGQGLGRRSADQEPYGDHDDP